MLGPTASGKSALAVEIATRFNGEVISADSRQVYKGLDIGTGKITDEEMRGISHYLLDIADPKERYHAAQFAIDAKNAIDEILSRGKVPILCGGTGYYIKVALGEIQIPDVPPNEILRKKLEDKPREELMTEIERLDPIRAKSLEGEPLRRIIRAIEIASVLGLVPQSKRDVKYNVSKIGINISNEELDKKIMTRLKSRILGGMISEIRNLKSNGPSSERMSELGLEYGFVSRWLDSNHDKNWPDEATAKLAQEISHYAKRQKTWFKKDQEIQWFTPEELQGKSFWGMIQELCRKTIS